MYNAQQNFSHKSPFINDIRDKMSAWRMSKRTESAYIYWIVQFIFHFQKRHPSELGTAEVTEYLSWLATEKKVAAATQNQCFNALIFLYNRILDKPLANINAERAATERRLPEWLTKEEIQALLKEMTGDNLLLAEIAYGAGLRLMELLRLRVKDFDFGNGVISVYQGKGKKSRMVPMPKSLIAKLRSQIERVAVIHKQDLADGFGEVFMPDSLYKKYPNASKQLGWQYLFPSAKLSRDKRSGKIRRHHLFETGFQYALREAGRKAGISKRVYPHMLRHTHATHLIEMGRSICEVQERLGHKDIKTTQIYVHCADIKNAPTPMDCLCQSVFS